MTAYSKHCERCKIFEKHTYWNEFPPTKHRFFTVMVDNYKVELGLPEKFTSFFKKGNIGEHVTLVGPSGNQWKVRATQSRKYRITLRDGWERFVRDHGLKAADFLMFSYKGNSTFEVAVFDTTGCERESAHFTKNTTDSAAHICRSSLHEEDDLPAYENAGEAEIGDSGDESFDWTDKEEDEDENGHGNGELTLNSSDGTVSDRVKGKTKLSLSPGSEAGFVASDVNEEEKEMGESSGTGVRGGKRRYLPCPRGYNLRSKRSRGSSTEMSVDGNDRKTEEVPRLCQRSMGKSGSRRGRKGNSSGAKQTQTVYISSRGCVTPDEKEAAQRKARLFILENDEFSKPMVEISMLPTYVYRGFHLTIPQEWAFTHLLKENHDVELHVKDQGYWIVGCRWSPNQCQFRPGWAKFVLENNVEQDDVCVFQLYQKGDTLLKKKTKMIVRIFRVVAKVKPLKSMRMS